MSKRLLVCMVILVVGVALLTGCFPFTKQYTLTITIYGEGSVSPAGGKYKAGTSLTLTATPEEQWMFENWSGGAFGHRTTVTVVMDDNLNVIANFTPTHYPVATTVEGEGTVEQTIVTDSKELIAKGSTVQLKAVPAAGWHFKEWQGDITGSLNPVTFTVDQEYNVKAVFVENAPLATWNFVVYLDGDNSLEEQAIADINEMEEIGSTADVNILVLVDRTPHYDSSNGDWTGSRLYRITLDENHTTEIVSELIHDYGELDMSDPQVLEDFLLFCQYAYPAEQTILTLWDHGYGVYPKEISRNPMNTVTPQGICWDDTTGTDPWICLTTDEIAATLANVRQVTGQKIEIINMDACLMQTLEIAYEWRNEVNYLVGSQADVPGGGNNYTTILQELTTNPAITALSFTQTLVNDYYDHYVINGEGDETYSALSLGVEFDNLITAFQDFATALKLTTDLNGVFRAWKYVTHFTVPEYDDLYDFAGKVITNSQDPVVVNTAAALQEAIANAVFIHKETANYLGKAFGLSITIASVDEWYEYYSGTNQYTSLLLSIDTDWDEFILRFVDYSAENASGQLLNAEITWPSGNCDLGIKEPDNNYYWSDQGPSPNGVFSTDVTNGGTESWSLNASYETGIYTPLVYSHDFTGTVNVTLTFNCGTFSATVEVKEGFGYVIDELQIEYVDGVGVLTYQVLQRTF